jgi:hypothetical protein
VRLGRGESSPANTSASSSHTASSVAAASPSAPTSNSLAGKSALVGKDGKFQKPTIDINDEDLINISEPDVRKKANDYSLVNNQDTSSESV